MIAAGLLAACDGEATPTPTPEARLSSTQAPAATPTATAEARLRSTQAPKATPTPTAEAKLSSTQAPQAPIVSPTPTPTAAAKLNSTQAPIVTRDDAYALAASAIPFFDEWLSEYEVWCYEMKNVSPFSAEDPTDFTYGELVAALAKAISATPATIPPDVIARWHNLRAGWLQSINDFADEQPEDDRLDVNSIEEHMLAWGEEQGITEDIWDDLNEEIPGYVRYQMASAGCILEGHLRDAATLKAVEFPNATSLPAGEIAEDSVEPYYDLIDYFRFQLEEGQLYRIALIPSTINNLNTRLYDADGQGISDGILWQPWQPPSSGDYYLEIRSTSVGGVTYQLKLIAHSDIDDDHGNSPEDATSITAGQSVAGAVDEWFDVDFFRFQAEEGQLYRIDVVPGTLPDAHLYTEDFDGWNFSTEPSERGRSFVGEAPDTGYYWVSIGHAEWGTTGTYTLTVAVP